MDCIRKQTYQWGMYNLKIVYKTLQQTHSGKHVFFNKIRFLGFHAVGTITREDSRPFHSCINYYCRTDIDEARVIYFLGL